MLPVRDIHETSAGMLAAPEKGIYAAAIAPAVVLIKSLLFICLPTIFSYRVYKYSVKLSRMSIAKIETLS